MTYYNSGYANLLTPLFPECWRSLAGCWRTGRGDHRPTCIIHKYWRFFKTMWLRNASNAILCEQNKNSMAQYLAQVLQ